MAKDTVVVAQLAVHGCTAALRLNDLPVSIIEDEPDRVPIENVPVEELLVPGRNVLELRVAVGSTPRSLHEPLRELPFREIRASARLLRFRDGSPGTAESGEKLLEVSFEWLAGGPDRQPFPLSRARSLDLGAANGRWSWQDAPDLVLDEALVDEACAVMAALEGALRAGDVGGVQTLMRPRIDDAHHAYPALAVETANAQLDDLIDCCRQVPEPFPPRERARHAFRLAGGGKLLELVDDDGLASFKLVDTPGGEPVNQPLLLGRIGGRLLVVR